MKALELGKPDLSFELLRNHAELLYHPGKSVISSYLDYFREQEDFEPLKEFFKAIKMRSFEMHCFCNISTNSLYVFVYSGQELSTLP